MSSRFAVRSMAAGYFAEGPDTAVHESLARRETLSLSLSLSIAGRRQLLCLQTTRALQLLDLRPHASTWPVLQSLRFSATQQLAAEAVAAGFEGIAYRSAQQYSQDCFVVFGAALAAMKLVWRKPLLLSDGSMHHALISALRGAQMPVVLRRA